MVNALEIAPMHKFLTPRLPAGEGKAHCYITEDNKRAGHKVGDIVEVEVEQEYNGLRLVDSRGYHVRGSVTNAVTYGGIVVAPYKGGWIWGSAARGRPDDAGPHSICVRGGVGVDGLTREAWVNTITVPHAFPVSRDGAVIWLRGFEHSHDELRAAAAEADEQSQFVETVNTLLRVAVADGEVDQMGNIAMPGSVYWGVRRRTRSLRPTVAEPPTYVVDHDETVSVLVMGNDPRAVRLDQMVRNSTSYDGTFRHVVIEGMGISGLIMNCWRVDSDRELRQQGVREARDNLVKSLHEVANRVGWCSEFDLIMQEAGLPDRLEDHVSEVWADVMVETTECDKVASILEAHPEVTKVSTLVSHGFPGNGVYATVPVQVQWRGREGDSAYECIEWDDITGRVREAVDALVGHDNPVDHIRLDDWRVEPATQTA